MRAAGRPERVRQMFLSPENLVGRVDAIVLTGGSVFGLGAADGAAIFLSSNDVGLKLAEKSPAIPIVPAAVLHDLGNDGDKSWGNEPPYRRLGAAACEEAAQEFPLGSVGAGRGAMAGIVKGGLGSASITLKSGVVIGALVRRQSHWFGLYAGREKPSMLGRGSITMSLAAKQPRPMEMSPIPFHLIPDCKCCLELAQTQQ